MSEYQHYEWQTVDQLLDSLAKLAGFRGSQTDYRRRLTGLCERYTRLSGFLRRVEQAKLLDEKTQ